MKKLLLKVNAIHILLDLKSVAVFLYVLYTFVNLYNLLKDIVAWTLSGLSPLWTADTRISQRLSLFLLYRNLGEPSWITEHNLHFILNFCVLVALIDLINAIKNELRVHHYRNWTRYGGESEKFAYLGGVTVSKRTVGVLRSVWWLQHLPCSQWLGPNERHIIMTDAYSSRKWLARTGAPYCV